jgi:hypothetical protein
MSQSGLGKQDPDLEGVELLFHQKGGSASFGAKMVLSLNGVDPSCMNSITGSTCRANCSNILHDSGMSVTLQCHYTTLFALHNLGNTTQIEMTLLVLCHPRWPRQGGVNLANIFSTKTDQLLSKSFLLL